MVHIKLKLQESVYEKSFEYDSDILEQKFDLVIDCISKIYPEGLSGTEFHRLNLFYSLFTTISSKLFPMNEFSNVSSEILNIENIRNKLERVDELFEITDTKDLEPLEKQFLENSKRATTDEKTRLQRTEFLLRLIG